MSTGKIGVTTENIFPVIKKFLYSDHEIFLRELVSNAVDATRKIQTLANFGEFKGELGDLEVTVSVDKEKGTLTVSDHGIGMDAEDIEKYINQIAFSGAEEFLTKYKDTANSIIGHFGLGFYSAFMVSKKVEIRSLSYKPDAKAVQWTCDGSPEFEMHDIDKQERGTDIILYIDDDSKEFLEQQRIDALLKKYCRFMPIPVVSAGKTINSTEPLWTRKPSKLSNEDYLKFYRELMPGREDPMFWIHLNVDYPFSLTGILYFPKISNQIDLQRNRIQLYCNQVYVTDQVEGVVPEFMTLMQGVIDSPDIPLNVSRSYLQADRQVKQISTYISKKVAEKLDKMYTSDLKNFESIWDDIKVFISYGMLTDDKFYQSAEKFYLVKDTKGNYYTLPQYRTLIEGAQTDKDGTVVYLYATDPVSQYSYIEAAEGKGYSVLLMKGELDSHLMQMLESKMEKTRFVRVDSEIAERIIPKESDNTASLNPIETEIASELFRSQIPSVEKAEFLVTFERIGEQGTPVRVVQNEYMRRMKEMASMQPGNSFMSQLPDSYSLVVNVENHLIKGLLDKAFAQLTASVKEINEEIAVEEKKIETAKNEKDKSDADESSDNVKASTELIASLRSKINTQIDDYAKSLPSIKQLIDLSLLESHLLTGEALGEFVRRSVDLLSKESN